ncbi:MAG: molybdopterin-dependent oxidoreductase [Burkholderiales bacterium]|nr:molybdopterin-dependent oxidoreductase [Burkholderiales bacterium]
MQTRTKLNTIGRNTHRKDGIGKVTGTEQYASDVSVPRAWYGGVLRSPHAHARIASIDTSAAEALGAVCLTFADVPRVKYNERTNCAPPHLYRDRYVLDDTARHVGEAVAAVAAPTRALAEKALRAIKVEYEVLPAMLCAADALKDGAPKIHETILYRGKETPIEHNVAVTRLIEVGDIEKGFAEADSIIEREFEAAPVYHAQMETKSVVCKPAVDGSITVWATTQSIHNTRQLLAEIYGLPLHKINVKKIAIGGTFGSSIQMNSVVPICVGLAIKSGRPVKIATTREEDMYDHCRYQVRITLKLGFKADGTLVAGHMKTTVELGAHNTQGYHFLGVIAGFWVSLYKLPNMKYEGTAVYTNRTPSCAMQGFGAPQATFVTEVIMDEIAELLGRDPVEYKLTQYRGLGDTFWGQGPTVKSIILSDGVPELLEVGAKKIGWDGRPVPGTQTGRFRRGIGMARSFHCSGVGQPRKTGAEMIDYSGAIVKLNEDGSIDYIQSLMDHGGGTCEAIAKLVAEEIGVPLSMVGISDVDTNTTVYDITTHATRGVFAGGAAALKAAKSVKAKILDYASQLLDIMSESLVIEPSEELGQGVIYCPGYPEKRMTLGELAKYLHVNSWGTIAAVESLHPVTAPPAYVTYFVEVEVDTETGVVKTLAAALGSDCGTVVNPGLAAGQLTGGLSKGAGCALIEAHQWDRQTGELASKGFWVDGKTLSILETPLLENLHIDFAHTYEPTGPFGAKGIGEASINPALAAYSNAIYNALGIRFREVPITAEKILAALSTKKVRRTQPAQRELVNS